MRSNGDAEHMNVLHCDDRILVANKRPGQLAQPDRTGDPDLLGQGKKWLARKDNEEDPFLGLVHRLDRPTSGVMIFARTSDAAGCLSEQFRERTVEKHYVALVEGEFRGVGTWTDYVAKPGRTPKLVSAQNPDGKFAELGWQALRRSENQSLLHIQLRTGRPHQIRLQAAERGAPVVADTRYGAAHSPADRGIALHHAVLRVDHPGQSRRMTFTTPLPEFWGPLLSDEMRRAVDRLLARARPAGSDEPSS